MCYYLYYYSYFLLLLCSSCCSIDATAQLYKIKVANF